MFPFFSNEEIEAVKVTEAMMEFGRHTVAVARQNIEGEEAAKLIAQVMTLAISSMDEKDFANWRKVIGVQA